MPTPPKPANLKTGHSKGRQERPTLGLVPAREPAAIVPKPPSGLLVSTRKVWRAYWESQVSNAADQQADLHRLHRWIHYVDEYERCSDEFRAQRLVKGSMGQPVLNPLATYLATIEANISRAENEMGLTPLARLRLGITYGQAMLTANELNKMLDGPVAVDLTDDAINGEWEPV